MGDVCKSLLLDFLENSWTTIEVLVKKLISFKMEKHAREVTLYQYINGRKMAVVFKDDRFFLRGSVEYANPQLTVEEIQGIIGIRLLEVCTNYFFEYGLHKPVEGDVAQLCEALQKPPTGYVVPFLLNTDDVEADRYSINPLKASIVESCQSSFPAAYVKTEPLKVDEAFVKKYEGTLISRKETELLDSNLKASKGSYLEFVDSVKYAQLEEYSKLFCMNLSLYSLRMPLSTLQAEAKDGVLHYIISESHRDYEAIEEAYRCMGRSMTKRTTLLTVPHSKKGYGSKRAARGKLHFEDGKLLNVSVKYATAKLYPNGIDPQDIAVAKGDDAFTVPAEKLADYSFAETPSSPQFFLYSMGSPEDAALWHGVGAFASPQLLQSLASARNACKVGRLVKNLSEKYKIKVDVPLQFNLVPANMWRHPIRNNIDASVGCVGVADLTRWGMRIEYLSAFK
ncbi:MAG: hypothetical protein NWE98_01255 [Candidatus Bathyarchaeota archaeon]|nr:hypothetical protein [Candidatus Bathyarchaeota archaeon]